MIKTIGDLEEWIAFLKEMKAITRDTPFRIGGDSDEFNIAEVSVTEHGFYIRNEVS